MNIYKSIGAILLAFMVNALLSVVTDFLLESIGILPDPSKGLFGTGAIILVLFYRSVYAIVSGYLIGRFAPDKPVLHAWILGIIALVITLMAVSHPDFTKRSTLWFGYTLAALIIPCILLGVKIQQHWSIKRQEV